MAGILDEFNSVSSDKLIRKAAAAYGLRNLEKQPNGSFSAPVDFLVDSEMVKYLTEECGFTEEHFGEDSSVENSGYTIFDGDKEVVSWKVIKLRDHVPVYLARLKIGVSIMDSADGVAFYINSWQPKPVPGVETVKALKLLAGYYEAPEIIKVMAHIEALGVTCTLTDLGLGSMCSLTKIFEKYFVGGVPRHLKKNIIYQLAHSEFSPLKPAPYPENMIFVAAAETRSSLLRAWSEQGVRFSNWIASESHPGC